MMSDIVYEDYERCYSLALKLDRQNRAIRSLMRDLLNGHSFDDSMRERASSLLFDARRLRDSMRDNGDLKLLE